MADPSPEVVAAALALAEASTKIRHLMQHAGSDDSRAWISAEAAYRAAIAPKLRTRAEVNAERLRNLDAFRALTLSSTELCMRDSILASEQTAPEPTEGPLDIDPKLRTRAEVDAEIVRLLRESVALGPEEDCLAACPGHPGRQDEIRELCREQTAPEPDPNHTHVISPDDACGCEASDALRDEVKELRTELERVLSHVILIAGNSYRVRDLVEVRQLVLEAPR